MRSLVIRRTALLRLTVIVFAMVFASAARAAEPATTPVADDKWRFVIAPYIWIPSVQTTSSLDAIPIEIETDTGSYDLFSELDFAFLVCGEIRKGKFGLFYDFQTLKISDDGTTQELLGRDFSTAVTFADLTLALEYRVLDKEKVSADILAGARGLYANIELDIGAAGSSPAVNGEENETWVDPIIGGKCRIQLAEHWGLTGYGDIGGFGVSSELTYTVMGTLFYEFNKHFMIHAGYRLYAVDFERDDFTFDATIHGPVVGLAFAF